MLIAPVTISMMLTHGRVPIAGKDSKFFAANGCISRVLPCLCKLGCESGAFFQIRLKMMKFSFPIFVLNFAKKK